MGRIDDILLLEKAGRLPTEMQADLDILRKAGRVPPTPTQNVGTAPRDADISGVREAAATAVEIGAPILGGIAGAGAGPLGAIGGSAAGGVAGRYAAEKIRGRDVTGRELLASGAVAAIPGGAAAKATRAGASILKRTLAYAAEGAVIGAGSTAVSAAIEEDRRPTAREVVTGAAAGAATGGLLGAAFGRRVGAANKVNDDASRATAVVAQAEAGGPPVVGTEPPPPGQRRIILPGETPPPDAGESVVLFGPDGKVLPNAGPILEKRMSVPLAETLKSDVLKRADEATAALASLSPDVKKQRFFRQLNAAVKDGLFNPEETVAQLHKNGWTMQQFFAEEVAGTFSKFEADVSAAGRVLGTLGLEKKRIMAALAADPETRKLVDDLAVAGGVDNPMWRLWWEVVDLDDVRRAAIIGQLATGHRNAVTQAGRLALEIPVDTLRGTFERFGMGAERPAGNPLATLYGFASSLRPRNTESVLKLLDGIGPEGGILAKKLFGSPISEAAALSQGALTGRPFRGLGRRMRQTRAEGLAERRFIKATLGPVADAATAYSALQENFFRRAALQSRLMQRARQKKLTWKQVQESPGLLSADDFEDALGHALGITFAAEPAGELGKLFLQGVRKTQPFSTQFIAFPRYLANFGKFFLDFNPVGALRLFSPTIRKERGSKVLSEAIVGTALLGAGTALRMSDRAGEKWYEMKTADGDERMNMVGLAGPFLPYLFLGELVARRLREEPTPRQMEPQDYLQGIAGLRLSPATTAMFDVYSKRKTLQEGLETSVGEFVGGFSVPLRTIRDFSAAFGNESDRLYLDPRDVVEMPGDIRTRALNPTIQNIPELGEKLKRPAAVSAVTGEKKKSEKPAQRQLFGATYRIPTDLGAELDRLGLDEFDLVKTTGAPKIDRELARRIGPLAQAVAPIILDLPGYETATPAIQKYIWHKLFLRFAKEAREDLKETNPTIPLAQKLARKFSGGKKDIALEQGVDIEKMARQLVTQAPGE